MKRLIFGFIATGAVLSAVVACKDVTKTSVNESPKSESKIMVSAEDSALFVDVFQAYLGYDQAYADSAAEKTDLVGDVLGLQADNASEHYKKNMVHVDSVLQKCIQLVGQRNYDELLLTLETERNNINVHPGNVIDNEIGLLLVYNKLYSAAYPESEDSFYMKMMPLYKFSELHLQLIENFGKGRHPFHDQLENLINEAKEHLNGQK